MRVKIKSTISNDIKEKDIDVLFTGHHVDDTEIYLMRKQSPEIDIEDIPLDMSTEIILFDNKESTFGFSSLWLRDKKNKIYEYDGFGHSGAASVITCLLRRIRELENQLKSEERDEA